MTSRIHNFNAGPAALPLEVLKKVQEEFLDFKGSGMSITEISHRSGTFEDVLNDTIVRFKRLLNFGDNYKVLFLQGGASSQFFMVPMNLLSAGDSADYINTGSWAKKAQKEAEILKKTVRTIASSEDRNYSYIPKEYTVDPKATYLHITSNNTIEGTQYSQFPQAGNVPLIADMSSDILCRPMDIKPFGVIYAGAQKNLGPSGVTLVIIRDDMLERVPKDIPTMLRYTTHAEKNSLYNTPPSVGIYMVHLVLKWIEETVGGLDAMLKRNAEKAELLYGTIDSAGGFYRGTADKDSRSLMNVTFRLPTEDLEKKFVAEAGKAKLGGLKGHRSVGGCRASIYNASGLDAVKDLTDFMKDFAAKNG
jgi:phosphoserine aminotransferase